MPLFHKIVKKKPKLIYSLKTNAKLPGAIMRDPAHDEVMKKIPDRQGGPGYKGPSRLASASYPTLDPPHLSAVVLVCPAADSCVACRELSCSSFIE